METGTVIRIDGPTATVRVDGRDRRASIRGALKAGPRTATNPVAAGDTVSLEEDGCGGLAISRVAERRNLLARVDPGDRYRCHVLAANIDLVVCVQAYRDPPLNLRSLDRFLILGHAAGVPAAIVINKRDLHEDPITGELSHHAALGIPVIETSARTGLGIQALAEILEGRISVIAGPSGAGKSSLLNAIVPGLHLRTRPVSRATSKGVHTTARVEWCDLPGGGTVLDTPGLRAIRPWGIDAENLAEAYPEFRPLLAQCRFPDCRHRSEPSCSVRRAVERGEVPAFRYDSYLRILATLVGEEEPRGGRGGR